MPGRGSTLAVDRSRRGRGGIVRGSIPLPPPSTEVGGPCREKEPSESSCRLPALSSQRERGWHLQFQRRICMHLNPGWHMHVFHMLRPSSVTVFPPSWKLLEDHSSHMDLPVAAMCYFGIKAVSQKIGKPRACPLLRGPFISAAIAASSLAELVDSICPFPGPYFAP